jgi:hypothetical protein
VCLTRFTSNREILSGVESFHEGGHESGEMVAMMEGKAKEDMEMHIGGCGDS